MALAEDDRVNLQVALKARDINPKIRVVLRQFNRTLARENRTEPAQLFGLVAGLARRRDDGRRGARSIDLLLAAVSGS